MANNFGDVALNLKPDWSRLRLVQNQFTLSIVGHEGGVADARLKSSPEEKHQFQWVEPKDTARIALFRTHGYNFVLIGEGDAWEVNPDLWVKTADNQVECYGLRLMARPERFYREEQKRKRESDDRRAIRKNDEAILEKMGQLGGFAVTDDDDRPLGRPMRRAR